MSIKVACPACNAKYTIAASKVVGKVVKIRCKKCEATIVIDDSRATDDQKGLIRRIIERAGEDATNDLSFAATQRLIKNSATLKQHLRKMLKDAVHEFSMETEERPVKEAVQNLGRFKPVEDQGAILLKLFPDLDFSHVAELAKQCATDQELVVIPKVSALAKCANKYGGLSPKQRAWPAFNRAMMHLLRIMRIGCEDIGFNDSSGGRIGPDDFRLDKNMSEYYAKLESETLGDAIVIPFPTIRTYRKTIVTRLDAFAVGVIVWVHRVLDRDHGWVKARCAGSEFTRKATGGTERESVWNGLQFTWTGIDDDADDEHAWMWDLRV